MKIKGSVAQGRTDLESLSSKTFADYDPWALITVDLDEGSFMNSGGCVHRAYSITVFRRNGPRTRARFLSRC